MQSSAQLIDDMTSGHGGREGAAELLRLAAAQRMNTDVRRAVFCAVMGSEDCMEAFEKLTRLPLKGEQDREIIRVLVNCCLQVGQRSAGAHTVRDSNPLNEAG